jgi:hypothetical protein
VSNLAARLWLLFVMVRASALPLEGHAQVGFCVEGLVHRCIAATAQVSFRPIPLAVGLHDRLTRVRREKFVCAWETAVRAVTGSASMFCENETGFASMFMLLYI